MKLEYIVVILLLVFTISPLQRLFEKITDKFFYQARYNRQNTIINLSRDLNTIVGREELENKILDTVVDTMKIKGMLILRELVGEGEKGHFKPGNCRGFKIDKQEDCCGEEVLYSFFSQKQEIIILEEWKRQFEDWKRNAEQTRNTDKNIKPFHAYIEQIIRELDRAEVQVAIPLLSKTHLIGAFLLKEKKSGDSFTSQDIELLELLSHQAAVALENASLYSDLEGRVQERTEQLNIRNRYLTTLQRITNQIIQSVDFKEVTRRIVDAVHDEMGYIGAFMLEYQQVTGDIRFVAITKSKDMKKALDKMGKVYEVHGNIDQKNVTAQVLKDRELAITSKFSDLVSPAVDAKLAGLAQRLVKMKTAIAVPIIVDDDVYGTLNFMLKQEQDTIADPAKDLMQAVTQLVAIVVRNSRLYEEIQDSNKKMQKANETINDQLKQLEEANRHLMRLDKAKTEFLSIASHQLRTPLSAIRGYLSLLEDGDYGEISEKQAIVLQKTEDNVKRLVALVNDLLSLARIEAGTGPKGMNVQEENLIPLIDLVVEELQVKAKNKDIELRWEKPSDTISLEMDKEKMEQVVMNLIDNALNYTLEGFVQVEVEDKGDTVLLKVHDSGIGMTSDVLDSLFTKFYRANDAIKVKPDGTGIGLYVCKTIVEAHKGRVWAESERGRGSTFMAEFPKEQKNKAQEKPAE